MHWTADDFVKIITAVTALVGAVASVVAAWRGIANAARLKQQDVKMEAIHEDVKATPVIVAVSPVAEPSQEPPSP